MKTASSILLALLTGVTAGYLAGKYSRPAPVIIAGGGRPDTVFVRPAPADGSREDSLRVEISRLQEALSTRTRIPAPVEGRKATYNVYESRRVVREPLLSGTITAVALTPADSIFYRIRLDTVAVRRALCPPRYWGLEARGWYAAGLAFIAGAWAWEAIR